LYAFTGIQYHSLEGGVEHMKKVIAVLAVVVLVVSMVSLVFAADMNMKKGTIKSVDAKAGTVVFCPEGTTTDMTLKADKSVDLSKVKVGDKVDASIEKDMLKHVMAAPAAAPAAKPKAAVGC
jgi:Cu/Ag efflux protein CusF